MSQVLYEDNQTQAKQITILVNNTITIGIPEMEEMLKHQLTFFRFIITVGQEFQTT